MNRCCYSFRLSLNRRGNARFHARHRPSGQTIAPPQNNQQEILSATRLAIQTLGTNTSDCGHFFKSQASPKLARARYADLSQNRIPCRFPHAPYPRRICQTRRPFALLRSVTTHERAHHAQAGTQPHPGSRPARRHRSAGSHRSGPGLAQRPCIAAGGSGNGPSRRPAASGARKRAAELRAIARPGRGNLGNTENRRHTGGWPACPDPGTAIGQHPGRRSIWRHRNPCSGRRRRSGRARHGAGAHTKQRVSGGASRSGACSRRRRCGKPRAPWHACVRPATGRRENTSCCRRCQEG